MQLFQLRNDFRLLLGKIGPLVNRLVQIDQESPDLQWYGPHGRISRIADQLPITATHSPLWISRIAPGLPVKYVMRCLRIIFINH